ncbi:TBC1 domain family member 12, partial [Nibea albiflora]
MSEEVGESFGVDLNENEEGGGGKRGLKPLSAALLAGVSGGQEAGKGRLYVTGNGRVVNTDTASGQPPPHSPHRPHRREIMLEEYLPGLVTDSCVISGDHGGLNGFTESFGPEETTMVGLGGGGGGTTVASCPAVLLETGRQMRQHPAGHSEGETPGDRSTVTGSLRTSLPVDGLPCPGNCASTAAAGPDVNMSNGGVDGDPSEAGTGHCAQQRLDSCDVDCGGVKVANGGLHILTRDRVDSGCSPENSPSDPGAETGVCPGDLSDCNGTSVSE